MKNPLHYQFSEYDCGPTTMQNAISFLFEREEIPPEILRNIDKLAVSSKYLSGKSVYIGNESYVNDALKRGGAVVLRLYTDEWHYVLLTGIDGKNVRIFDPYYCDQEYEQKDIIRVLDQPTCCNRIVPWKYFNKTALNMYSLGPYDGREAVILFNEKTRLTEEETIEYCI